MDRGRIRRAVWCVFAVVGGVYIDCVGQPYGGGGGGLLVYVGELNPIGLPVCPGLHVYVEGGAVTGRKARQWALGAMLAGGSMCGDDSALPENYSFERRRGLSFGADFVGLMPYVGFLFFPMDPKKPRFPHITPTLYGGVGVLWFRNSRRVGGYVYSLRLWNTEAQFHSLSWFPSPYWPFAFSVWVAPSVELRFSGGLSLVFWWRYVWLSTDYIDDVSSRYPPSALFERYYPGDEARIARTLSYPSWAQAGELSGRQRGERTRKDHMMMVGLGVRFYIVEITCPLPPPG